MHAAVCRAGRRTVVLVANNPKKRREKNKNKRKAKYSGCFHPASEGNSSVCGALSSCCLPLVVEAQALCSRGSRAGVIRKRAEKKVLLKKSVAHLAFSLDTRTVY